MFYLEEPSVTRKYQAIDYINEFFDFNSKINGVGKLNYYLDDYESWLKYLNEEEKIIPSEDSVPTKTYFLINADSDKIVGMVNIRLALNENAKKYGHVGYSIRPTERRKGYNKINLYLALIKCEEFNIKEALMICEKDNLGSLKTIEALGGEKIGETKEEYKYIIKVSESIIKYKDLVSKM